jgi:hypothetical protein
LVTPVGASAGMSFESGGNGSSGAMRRLREAARFDFADGARASRGELARSSSGMPVAADGGGAAASACAGA